MSGLENGQRLGVIELIEEKMDKCSKGAEHGKEIGEMKADIKDIFRAVDGIRVWIMGLMGTFIVTGVAVIATFLLNK